MLAESTTKEEKITEEENYDCDGELISKSRRVEDSSGLGTYYRVEKYKKGVLYAGIVMETDINGKSSYKSFNSKTQKYEDNPNGDLRRFNPMSNLRLCQDKDIDFKPNEIVGGFSLIREDSEPEDFNTYGFQSSYTRYLNKTVGLTGDFSANFRQLGGVDLTKTSLMGGATVLPFSGANGDDRVRFFTRAIFGVAHLKADFGTASFTDQAFAAQLTGGLDINLNDHLFVRPIEAGFAPTHFNGQWQGNRVYRFGFGLRF